MTLLRRSRGALIIVAALVVAGCIGPIVGSGNSGSSTEVSNDDIGFEVDSLPAVQHSPLAEYTHLFFGTDLDEAAQRRQFEALQVRRENLIAECMAELGFDYLPHLESVSLEFADNEEWRPDDPDWVAQWGYGIVSAPIPFATDGPIFMMGGDDFGPNNQILAELSDSERAAWEDALWGEVLGDDLNCFSRAWNQAWNEVDIASADEFTPLIEAINQFQLSLEQEISEADQDWALCLANAGYPGFSRQRETAATVFAERQEVIDEITRKPDWVGEPTTANSPLLAALQEREISLAVADLSCRHATNYQIRHNAQLAELEAQFVADHRAALEALRSAIEQR